MRETATNIITTAAISVGMAEKDVMMEPDSDSITLPKRRIEISYLAEQYAHSGHPLRKRPTPGKEKTHRTLSRKRHSIKLPVRVALKSDDAGWLKDFSRRFVAALPKRTTDEFGNAVTVSVEKAEYGGFTTKAVEVFKKRSKTYHITFTGMTTTESEIPLIKSVTITPKYREASNEQEKD